ncbi:OB-fold protein [Klebsiella aerogenes]|uniref:OB-fold protein n=1 Tax=Klebsiella aerogenes TaxID=548 RepID=UPI001F32321D|nr:hypothetical protein [Klebsiella aerogenes]
MRKRIALVLLLLSSVTHVVYAEEIYSYDLSEDYADNSTIAAQKYENKSIEIYGVVSAVYTAMNKKHVIQLYGRNDSGSVDMMVSEKDPLLTKISKYNEVHAICSSPIYILGDVLLKECKIISFKKLKHVR